MSTERSQLEKLLNTLRRRRPLPHRRRLPFAFVWITLLLLAGFAHASDRPNILLIYVDDLGYGDLGSYGHPVLKTPNIDALANDGLRLTSAYAPSALCSPSRAGLLTGRHPYRTGIRSWIPEASGVYLRDEEVTLAELLNEVGYATALIGKWHLNSDLASADQPQPTDQGFDYFYGHNAFQIPHNHNPTNVYRDRTRLPPQEGYTADLYAGEAIRWLEARDDDEPFFLYLSMAEPHTTIANPPEYNQIYAEYTRGPIAPIESGLKQPPKAALLPRGPGEYYANITYLDAQLGRVLGWLRDHDLDEQTVVVFSSDNGPVTSRWINWWEVNAHGSTGGLRGRKHFLYEGGIRVPTIIRYPALIKPGTTSDVPVVGMDLFVTLARLGNASLPDDRAIDGIDLEPVFSGGALPERSLLWALDSVSELEFAVRQGAWKLLLDRERSPRELYNLAEDPLELFNLLATEPVRASRLQQRASALLKDIDSDRLRPR
ncbi:MAG: sulfatase-like hydrolase/transferase [Pseudomonadota bacterium]